MKIKLLIAIMIPLLFVGCDSIFDKGDAEKTFKGEEIGFFLDSDEVNQASGTYTIEVQLIGEQRNSDVTVTFARDAESTAAAGTHYTISGNTVTIPAGESTADITVNLIDGSVAAGGEVTLILNLTDAGGVKIAPNLSEYTLFIQG
jgi:uncharacterized protein YceK